MRIITFLTDDPECPIWQRAVARIRAPVIGVGGKAVLGWHPIIIYGPDREAARLTAAAWLEEAARRWAALSPPKRKAAIKEAAAGYETEIDFGEPVGEVVDDGEAI